MRDTFQRELTTLSSGVVRMASQVKEMTYLAVEALRNQDIALADQVIHLDQAVDKSEAELEEQCLKLLALQQPVAKDLRFVGAVLKMLTDLERAGDQAAHVAEAAVVLAKEPLLRPYTDIVHVRDVLVKMADAAVTAFLEQKLDAAREVYRLDDIVDDIYHQAQRGLLTYMLEDPRTIGRAIVIMNLLRALERLGDHLENIAERIEYLITGRRGSAHQPPEAT
ncbi:MAG: phosphate signaling complex protein PhoU [Deinococcus sp.]|nr:phosphate signaling complex protein PhoU [Deinococcus sp.]